MPCATSARTVSEWGRVPFGYRTASDGLHLEAHPAEQGILSRIRDLKAAGYTTRRIAAELNRQGFTTRHGTAWRFSMWQKHSGRRRMGFHAFN